MKPRIICHMFTTIDGRIDGKALRVVSQSDMYEHTGSKLGGDAWICGRNTMQQHFAEPGSFTPANSDPAGEPSTHIVKRATSYAVAVDTRGSLIWSKADLDGDHLICVLSERVAKEYLEDLRSKEISYIVVGRDEVDLVAAAKSLTTDFGIHTLLLEGGGKINGAFLQAGLVDEVSLLIAPVVDGRDGMPSLFDGRRDDNLPAVPLRLQSVQQMDKGTLWIRYEVLQATTTV